MRARVIREIVIKELKLVVRNKAFMFWNIVFPLLMLTLFVALFAPKPHAATAAEPIKVLMLPEDHTRKLVEYAKELARYLEGTPAPGLGVRVELFNGTLEEALGRLKNGTCDAVVLVPRDAVKVMESNMTVKSVVYILTGTPQPYREQLTRALLTSFYNITGLYIAASAINWSAAQLVPYVESTHPPKKS